MLLMHWSDELAMSAQRHANRCDFRHSTDRINVGENIWAAPYSNYTEAVSRWFNEVYDSRCDCKHAYKHCCGHYVQVVWAETNLVGCGYAKCRNIWGTQNHGHRHIFVCHYNPQGNTVYVTRNGFFAIPAFTWAGDKPRCSDCPSNAPACSQGLCFAPSLSWKEVDPDLDANQLGQN
ncbi:SCP-like extracellular protein [Loa loa]|nr:SCP-like extracellular protein [Loa loa]EFO14135.1 SCP-like extracellular protein [Loa loa]